MNTKTLTQLLVGSGAIAALAMPLFLVRADSTKNEAPKSELKIEIEGDRDGGGASGVEGQLKRFLDGFGGKLNDDQKKELDNAFEKFRNQLKQPSDGEEPRRFKFEWRSDDSKADSAKSELKKRAEEPARPAPRSRGKVEIKPNENDRKPAPDSVDDLREQLRRHFEGFDFDRFFGEDFLGPLLRGLDESRRGQAPDAGSFERGGPKRNAKYEKAARRALAEFREVVNGARESVITLYRRGDQVALATIVTADGYALSKASMLGKGSGLEAEFSNGRTVDAKVVDTVKDYDLALIKLEARDLKPVQWSVAENIAAGTLVAAAGPDEDPIAIGVISVPVRNLAPGKTGYLGVTMDSAEGGVKVGEGDEERPGVAPGSAAEKAGLKSGDIIISVDGKPVRSPRELSDLITSKKPEDEVHITYKRGNEERTAVATLGSRDDIVMAKVGDRKISESEFRRMMRQGDLTARMGGNGNDVADGFPNALQNDLFINVDECGGPIIGIDGRAVGLNIARAERTKTYAIPATALKSLLADIDKGKFTQALDLSDLKREAHQAEQSLEDARKKLKDAEEKAKTAREALEGRVK
jgi:serine protease Do